MASKITIKRSLTAAAPAGLSFGEMAFVQGSGLTANQLYVGISGGSPAWVGAQIGTTGTWTDTAAQTTLATQHAIEQRIGAKISAQTAGVSSFNGVTGAVTGVSSFNGLTGAVSGVTTSVANTFTALQTFSAGISASGGTFSGDIRTTQSTASIFSTTATTLNIGAAATTMTLGAMTGYAAIRNPQLILGGSTAGIFTDSEDGTSHLTIAPLGNLILSPIPSINVGGDNVVVTITNTDQSNGQVQIEGGDLHLGNKINNSGFKFPVNIIFDGVTADANKTTLTVTDPTATRTITLPDATGTVALTATSVASFNGVTGAVTGVSSFNGATGAVSIVAGTGISISGATGAVTVNSTYVPAIATTGVTGVASFDSGDFAVSGAGAVTIKAAGVGNTQLENPNITINGATIALGTTYNFKISEFNSATSAELSPRVSDATGTGVFVLATGPTLSAPIISTNTIKNSLKIAASIPITDTMSGVGPGDVFVLRDIIQTLTNKTLTGATLTSPSLGTPTLLVGTNITGTASSFTAGSVTTNADLTGAITSVGNGTTLGSFTSAHLRNALTDETGTGVAVFGTSPAITTSLTTPSTSFDLLNTTATTVNFAGAGLTLNIGNASGTATFAGSVIVNGDFTVQGNTTTLNTTTLNVEDFNITMGLTLTNASQCTGAGIAIGVGTGITFAYDHSSLGWLSSVNMDLATGKVFKIANASVLSSSALGAGVTGSSLTQVGTITSGTWQGTAIASAYVATLNQNTTGSAATVTTAAQPAITSVGTLTSLTVSGTLEAGLIDGGTF